MSQAEAQSWCPRGDKDDMGVGSRPDCWGFEGRDEEAGAVPLP